ncbi:MAG: AmmeMemoRadiSam system protein A, partial [Spirochaetes bacterium]|nr:AmmeMemoRadiSam system protein A [Spirochaetota bacterium]
RMNSAAPLIQTIQEMAVAAAFQDPRFPPLNQAELALVDIELSILSPIKASKPKLVQPGLHGVHLHFHGNSGVFLPQVATEQGWDRETLLENLCYKAGVPSGSHLLPGAVLQTFTAFVFGEKQLEQFK